MEHGLPHNVTRHAVRLQLSGIYTRVTLVSTPLLDSTAHTVAMVQLQPWLEELDLTENQSFSLHQFTLMVVSSMNNLKKLSLTFSSYICDLDPLSRLTTLTHVHLTHMTQGICCKAVLHSSRLTLQHVHLSAPVCSCATFEGLHTIAQLDTVRIAIRLATLTQQQLTLFDTLKCTVKEMTELDEVPARRPLYRED